MKIYTKTGDKGETSLWGGKRVAKNHPRIEAYGTVDELNVCVGMVRDYEEVTERTELLIEIQKRLFTIGSVLAADPEKNNLPIPDLLAEDVTLLERWMDTWDAQLPPLKNFILPGGSPAISASHLARVTCRKAERMCIALSLQEPIFERVIEYLNRLSDFFFMYGRFIAKEGNIEETPWLPRNAKS